MQIPCLMQQFDGVKALISEECNGGDAKLFIFSNEVFVEGMVELLHNDIRMFLEFLYFIDNWKTRILLEAEHYLKLFLN